MSALVERLEADGPALSRRVLDDMYRDPFWTERYGDRGRRHADEDSDFHLRYLSRALAAGDAGVLRRYAVWLREVLATRGMCTRHLDENFRLLAREIEAQPWPGREQAVAFLREAREALAHADGSVAALQRETEALAEAIVRDFARSGARWKRDARGEGALRDDAANYLSYVADALAFARPELLAAHARWFDSHVQTHGARAQDLAQFRASVRKALAEGGWHDAVALLDGRAAAS